MSQDKPNFETRAIRMQQERSPYREHSVPLFMTSSFVFDDAEQARALFADEEPGNIYSRFSNPNTTEFIEKMASLENTEDGHAFASGMAAVFSSMAALLDSGDHVLASRALFGSTHQVLTKIMPRWKITHDYVDSGASPDDWERSINENTKMIYIETPSNPGLEIIDLEWIGKFAQKHNLILNVDNCFATPYIQTPADYGAHLVSHSATKFIDGQGRAIGGIVLGTKELIKEIRFFARHSGPSLSPFNAWLFSKSLETLAIRMEKHCENAFALAKHLEGHAELERVIYPFLDSYPNKALAQKQMKLGGGLVSFVVKGGIDRGRKFLNSLEMFSHTANLGDSRTIATHPASTTHSKLTEDERQAVGIYPGLIRVSVGLEHIDDITAEIERALVASK